MLATVPQKYCYNQNTGIEGLEPSVQRFKNTCLTIWLYSNKDEQNGTNL